jgi:hypothetical protein
MHIPAAAGHCGGHSDKLFGAAQEAAEAERGETRGGYEPSLCWCRDILLLI